MESASVAQLFTAYEQWHQICKMEDDKCLWKRGKRREVRFISNECTTDKQALITAEFWVRRNTVHREDGPSRYHHQLFVLTGAEAKRLRRQLQVQYVSFRQDSAVGEVWRMSAADFEAQGARPLRELRLRAMLRRR